jgi:hypothetical protein
VGGVFRKWLRVIATAIACVTFSVDLDDRDGRVTTTPVWRLLHTMGSAKESTDVQNLITGISRCYHLRRFSDDVNDRTEERPPRAFFFLGVGGCVVFLEKGCG